VVLTCRFVALQANYALETSYITRGMAIIVYRTGRTLEGGSDADRAGIHYGKSDQEVIRLVGDVKTSWNWRTEWRKSSRGSREEKEYRQVISQVHYYMNQKDAMP
jgi:hypothetical protein